jgi:glucokinase
MFLGIEIGGTKLQLGLGEGDGSLRSLWRGNVDVSAGGEGIRRQIAQAVPELLAQPGLAREHICGVGVGVGGPVDDHTKTVIKSHQIHGWDNFPLAAWLTDMLAWPVALGNDADVAGLAEALFGAGQGLSPIFYITIGSGIGGGLIVDGEIYRGIGLGAAEIGHLRIFDPKTKTIDILEHYASGWAIGHAPELTTNYRLGDDAVAFWSSSEELVALTASDVAQAAASGNKLALRILDGAWEALAEAICHVIALLCPKRVVIGGGVALMGEKLLFEPLRAKVAARVFKPFAGCYDIVPAALGEEVVVHGALALARKRFGIAEWLEK